MGGDYNWSLLYFLVERGWKIEDVMNLSSVKRAMYQGIASAYFELNGGDGD